MQDAAERVVPGPRSRLVDLVLIALLAVGLRAPTLSISVFDADESAFILAAREVVLGNLPYLTFWDHRPPGSPLLIAAVMAAFGQSLEVVRVLGLVCVVCTSCLLYVITQRISPWRLVPIAASLLYIAFSTRLMGLGTMTEILLAPFTAAGVALLLLVPDRRSSLELVLIFAAAGLAFGVATWIKYLPAIPAALVGGFALITVLLRSERGLVRAAACGGAFGTGLLLPVVASIVVYWNAGFLDEFWYANFGFASRYVGMEDHPRGMIIGAISLASIGVLQIWPLIAATLAAFLPASLKFFFDQSRSYQSAIVGFWLIGEILALWLPMKFYDQHFLAMMPPLCIVSAVSLGFYVGRLALPSKAVQVLALAVAFVALVPITHHVRETAAELSRDDMPRQIARMAAAGMRPHDLIFVVDYEPIIYFFADAPLPTRFAYPATLVGRHRTLIVADPRAEIQRILDSKPRFVVMNTSWRDNLPHYDAQTMTLVEERLAQRYTPHAAWMLPKLKGTVQLFVLRD